MTIFVKSMVAMVTMVTAVTSFHCLDQSNPVTTPVRVAVSQPLIDRFTPNKRHFVCLRENLVTMVISFKFDRQVAL